MGIIRDTFNALFKGKIFNTEINEYPLKEQYEETLETRKRTSEAIGSLEDNKADKINPTFTGVVNINGDIIQNGTAYETHVEQIYTEKDEIILRDGAISGLGVGILTGLRAKKYDGVNDGILGYDKDGFARVGDVGATQKIATIEDNPINIGIPYYDNVSKILKTMDLSPNGTTTTNNIQKILKTENNVKVVQGVPTGAQFYGSINPGYLKITLPTKKNNVGFSCDINIYSHKNQNGASKTFSKLRVKGFNNLNGFGYADTLENQKALILADKDCNIENVSFCTGATEDYLLIKCIDNNWFAVEVHVNNVETHFTDVDWSNGWNISLVTSLENLDSTHKVTVTPSLNTTHFDGKDSTFYRKWLGNLSNIDLNNYKYNCAFYAITGCTNLPSNETGYLNVRVTGDNGVITQTATRPSTNVEYRRSYNGSTWTSWERVLGASELTTGGLDTTIGKILKVGDFGLGRGITIGNGVSLDTLVINGFYMCNVGTELNRPTNSALGAVFVNTYATNRVSQLYMDINGRAWLRGSSAVGVWTPWREVATDSMVVAMLIKKSATNALDVQNDSGTSVFTVDTINNRINVNSIKFPATQIASTDPNTLDDYEEGTFTPTITIGGSSTGITYSVQEGFYTKIGNICNASLRVKLTSKGGLTGAVLLQGLPFISSNSFSGIGTVYSFYLNSSVQAIIATMVNLSSNIFLAKLTNGLEVQLTATDILDNLDLRIQITYKV